MVNAVIRPEPAMDALPNPNPPGLLFRPWLLAIDTATDQAGLALLDGVGLTEVSWPGGRRQTTSVLPVLEELLTRVGATIAQVGAVAVAAGPGSFTGLRVGLSLAKGLAITGDRVVIGVNTLDVAAAPFVGSGVPSFALVPAGRGRVVWSQYGASGDAMAPVNASFEEFLKEIVGYPDAFVVGELTPDQLAAVAAVHDRVASMPFRRPGDLARIGFDRWRRHVVDDPITLEPLYLHGRPNPR